MVLTRGNKYDSIEPYFASIVLKMYRACAMFRIPEYICTWKIGFVAFAETFWGRALSSISKACEWPLLENDRRAGGSIDTLLAIRLVTIHVVA